VVTYDSNAGDREAEMKLKEREDRRGEGEN
jgi:hypothetical protein